LVAVRRRGLHAATFLWLRRATALAGLILFAAAPAPAQDASADTAAPDIAALTGDRVSNSDLLQLEADRLIYDNDKDVVTAAGSVRIDYGGNRLVADRVIYNRKTGRLRAEGGVELFDRDGVRYTTNEVDVTDDFAQGFINALRVQTVNQTYFAAESADRSEGRITVFNNGVYTACAPCEEQPDRPPIWRVKAQTTIWNQQTKTVRFINSRFEFFGLPLAYFPVLEVPDPTVKRKSGFLIPSVSYREERGLGVTVPYYFALSPTYDVTLTPTYFSRQGFLADIEFRKRFNSGQISLRTAGISQRDPEAYRIGRVDRGLEDDLNYNRGMIGSQALFQINPRWTFGWDVLTQSDKNFAKSFGITGYNTNVRADQVFLEGLNDRNYFDLRTVKFNVQEETLSERRGRDKEQPWVLPTFDYSATPDEPVLGGELDFDLNARVIDRDRLDAYTTFNDVQLDDNPFVRGLEGTNSRVTAEAEWKRSLVTPGGVVVTPLLAFQADTGTNDASDESLDRIAALAARLNASTQYTGIPVEDDDGLSSFSRYMATLGLETRWPVLFSFTSASHVLEPMAQVFVRPDEQYLGELGIPNEDAQSFVFDATTLFERDKFSGYDRIEGGSRANIGLRYSGSYDNGFTTNAILGQSYVLGGENSFDAPDLVNVGAYSGLESEVSDYVGLVGLATPVGLSLSASGRFDEDSFEMRRGELRAGYTNPLLSLTTRYAYIQAQPLYGFNTDRQEVSGAASLQFAENWRAFTSATYDLEREALVKDAIGLGYDDECFNLAVTFAETRNAVSKEETQTIGFNISFRTLGAFGTSTEVGGSSSD
jgi:LPS-assembly protein